MIGTAMHSIGIITAHRPKNVGAALQAYATQLAIKKLGYSCEIIDYIYPNDFHGQATLKSRLLKLANNQAKRVLGGGSFERFEQRFADFLRTRLSLSASYPTPEALQMHPPIYDLYVAGSDQIWRSSYMRGDPSFFCAFAPHDKRVISYASSFGVTYVHSQYRGAYVKYLKRFSHLSVRETEGAELIRELSGRTATVVLDPTLLLSEQEWESLLPPAMIEHPYVLCYGNAHSDEYVKELGFHVNRLTGLPLVWFYGRPWQRFSRSIDHVFDAGPLEFLALVKNASLVLTQSLHGTIFSIIFRRPFYSIHMSKQAKDTRQLHLLRLMHTECRGLEVGDKFPNTNLFEVDYASLASFLQSWRENSLNYLRTALAG